MPTTNMALTLPTVLVTLGPTYATLINTALTTIDEHDHASGRGVRITPAGMNINSDLDFGSNYAKALKASRYSSQVAALASVNDVNQVYVVNGNLFFNNASGTAVQITSGTGLNLSSIGAIGGDYGAVGVNASVTYSNTTKAYSFTQEPGITGSISSGPLSIFRNVASSPSVTFQLNASIAGSYSLTIPAALPASDAVWLSDSSGNVSFERLAAFSKAIALTSAGTALAVSNNATIGGTLGVTGLSTLASLTVTGVSTLTGNVSLSGTLGVVGATTLAALTATGNVAVGGTLGVVGASTLAALSATTGVFSSTLTSGSHGITGTLSVSGASTLAALSATTGAFSSTLGVIGASTLAALSATTGAFSSTLSAAGATTLAALTATGNTAIGGTLGVVGASTLAAMTATTGVFTSTLDVDGAVDFDSTLDVLDNATFRSTITSIARIRNGAGSVGTPSYSFIDSPATGFYHRAANSVGFAANGVTVGYWSSSGEFELGPVDFTGTQTFRGTRATLAAKLDQSPQLDIQYNGVVKIGMYHEKTTPRTYFFTNSVPMHFSVDGGSTSSGFIDFTTKAWRLGGTNAADSYHWARGPFVVTNTDSGTAGSAASMEFMFVGANHYYDKDANFRAIATASGYTILEIARRAAATNPVLTILFNSNAQTAGSNLDRVGETQPFVVYGNGNQDNLGGISTGGNGSAGRIKWKIFTGTLTNNNYVTLSITGTIYGQSGRYNNGITIRDPGAANVVVWGSNGAVLDSTSAMSIYNNNVGSTITYYVILYYV